MTAKLALPDVHDLYALYQAGESTVDMGKRLGCHSSTLRNLFKRNDLPLRSFSEMQVLLNGRRSPARRREMTAAAHAAVRGRKVSFEAQCRSALGRERRPPAMSEPEEQLLALLQDTGLAVQFQRACGPYNIDLAVDHAIAVECFGGGWHGSGRHAARHDKRTRYLLDAGWHVVIVWVDGRRRGGWITGLKDVIADLKRSGGNPTATRQYRVVWSDGEVVAGRPDVDDFPLKPPGEVSRDPASGRYRRAG